MTREQFAEIIAMNFRSISAAAQALDFDRDTINAAISGETRKGADFPLPRRLVLALKGYLAEKGKITSTAAAITASKTTDNEGVQIYYNDSVREISPDLWFQGQTAEFERVRESWPQAAAVILSVLMGCPARVDGSDWVAASPGMPRL